jgi:hypothetical protein
LNKQNKTENRKQKTNCLHHDIVIELGRIEQHFAQHVSLILMMISTNTKKKKEQSVFTLDGVHMKREATTAHQREEVLIAILHSAKNDS